MSKVFLVQELPHLSDGVAIQPSTATRGERHRNHTVWVKRGGGRGEGTGQREQSEEGEVGGAGRGMESGG